MTSALRRPAAEWQAVMNKEPIMSKDETKYLEITVRGHINGDDVDYETQVQGGAGWEKNDQKV